MRKLISDRRLYLTEDGDQVVEERDASARFLLVGAGGTILAAEVERLGLTTKRGRVRYPGGPSLAKLTKPKKDEARASKVDEPKEELVFGGDKTGGREKIENAEPAVDDSDRNDGPPPEWPGRMSPAKYLERYPTGPKAELARAVIAAQDDGADGAS